jgi:hypothetical protein
MLGPNSARTEPVHWPANERAECPGRNGVRVTESKLLSQYNKYFATKKKKKLHCNNK